MPLFRTEFPNDFANTIQRIGFCVADMGLLSPGYNLRTIIRPNQINDLGSGMPVATIGIMETILTLDELFRIADERKAQGNWVPACNGTETPFTTRTGRRLLYCYQASTGNHAYLDLGTDMILSAEDAALAMGMA